MHESTPQCLRRPGRQGVRAVVAALLLPAVAAAAEPALPASGVGPWLFASVALLLVAAGSFAAGAARRHHRQEPQGPQGASPTPPAASAQSAAATDAPPLPARVERAPVESPLYALATRLVADSRPVLLIADDGSGGPRRLLRANAAALRRLGLDEKDIGHEWSALSGSVPALLREVLQEPDPALPADLEGWWLLRDASQRLVLALGSADEGRAEADAALGYTVSHDLRAPIRVVEGFTRIVKEDYGRQLDRVANDHLERVLAAAARMNQMIDAMLTMARLSSQPLVRQRVDLSQLAGFVVDDLRRTVPTREADIEIEPELRAQGDPTLLRLVLENLLGNAWKYSDKCDKAHIEFRCVDDHGQRTFIVRDNGAGFDMRVADRLFGLFQRLHSAKDFPGTGVGLASVKRIVQRHGGQVWAEATPGKGATFHFTLRD